MRARFLITDYFTTLSSSSSTSIQTLEEEQQEESLSFLTLPIPRLPLFSSSSTNDPLLRFHIDSVSIWPLDHSVDTAPIDAHSALSKLFAAVLPHKNEIEFDFHELTSSASEADQSNFLLFEEKEMEIGKDLASESAGVRYAGDGKAADSNKDPDAPEVVEFEAPEPNEFLDKANHFESRMLAPSDLSQIENNGGFCGLGIEIQHSEKFEESIYSVNKISLEFVMEQNAYSLDSGGYIQDQMHVCESKFPLLEVDEISEEGMMDVSVKSKFLSLFEVTEHPQKANLTIIAEELLGSAEYNILELLLNHCQSKQCPKFDPEGLATFAEAELMSILETSYVQEYPIDNCKAAGAYQIFPINPLIFEEFQLLDVNTSFEVSENIQTVREPESCHQLFKEGMGFKNFNELIVSHELALVDNTFTSLPIPILSDGEKIWSPHHVVEGLLIPNLKPLRLSASSEIYLDWHYLEVATCSSKVSQSNQDMLRGIDPQNLDFDLTTFDDGKLMDDLYISDDETKKPREENYEKLLNMSSGDVAMPCGLLTEFESKKLRAAECSSLETVKQFHSNGSEKASLFFKSMSNGLDYFLNLEKNTMAETIKPAEKLLHGDLAFHNNSLSDLAVTSSPSWVKPQQCDILSYQVRLSDSILSLIDNLKYSYLDILKNETELMRTYNSFQEADDLELLRLSRKTLMECIGKVNIQRATLVNDYGQAVPLITLCAIKQMAWFMCFYGIKVAHIYVDELCQRFEPLKSKLSVFCSLFQDAYLKAHDEMTISHPSLSIIQEILMQVSTDSSLKILIAAEEVFWWSLKNLLTCLRLSYNELKCPCTSANEPDSATCGQYGTIDIDALMVSGCVLVSLKHISASFPFNKFSIILEYGGSYSSSRISSLFMNIDGLPCLHFLRMELDDFNTAKALCEGIDMEENINLSTGKKCHLTLGQMEKMHSEKLEELLNFIPLPEKVNRKLPDAKDGREAICMPKAVSSDLLAEPERIQQNTKSLPVMIIIVNTQSSDKEMIFSRTSTYQRILAMEREGVQVVERDSDLPVDVIISAMICLVWYNCRNIGKEVTNSDEAFPSLPSCIENIATNVLTRLSYSFSSCILVFEGDSRFLATIMDSSGGLYAAAASLGIKLQLFCSYSSDLTDEIILSCIRYAAKLTSSLYPKMLESENLAESFLTKFPSINPLTAHAILSLGGILIQFLEWSQKRRLGAIEKCHVPNESIALFGILCRYGEREDSKSIMTDCSSSVSSGPDSENSHSKVDYEFKRRKLGSPQRIDIPVDDLLHFEPVKQHTNDISNPPKASKPCYSWMFEDTEIFKKSENPLSSWNGSLGQMEGLDNAPICTPTAPKRPDPQISVGFQAFDDLQESGISLNNRFSGCQGIGTTMMNNFDWENTINSESFHGGFTDNVIDLNDGPVHHSDFSCIDNNMNFSPWGPEINNATQRPDIAGRLYFGQSRYTTFPTAAEVNSGSSTWISKALDGGTDTYLDTDLENKLPDMYSRRLSDINLTDTSSGNYLDPQFEDTRLSKAVLSNVPRNSPWTIEFLNGIKKKSRLRQQFLPYDTSPSKFVSSGSISKPCKRRSPSILDFFKYQGGRTMKKPVDLKRQNNSAKSSSSSRSNHTSVMLPSMTPLDKRARQTLSFAINKGGNQTKLVWGDEHAYRRNKRFRR